MSTIENNNINQFLSNTFSESKRKEFVEKLELKNNSKDKMNKSNNNIFDSENAWNKFYVRLESDNLLATKKTKVFALNKLSRIAAAIVLIVGLSITGLLVFNANDYIETSSFSDLKEVVLPDGSVVTLNSNSSIKYPEKFNKDSREVEFTGEAFFEVTKNPNQPFVIKTSDANVRVLGTSFNLSAQNNNTELVVTTGRVELSKRKNKSEKVILDVGERGSIVNNIVSEEVNKDLNYLAWKTKNLYYSQDITLNDLFNDLNRIRNTNIFCEDDEVGNLPISHKHFKNFELDTIFEIIFLIHPDLDNKEVDGKIIISKKDE